MAKHCPECSAYVIRRRQDRPRMHPDARNVLLLCLFMGLAAVAVAVLVAARVS